MDPKPTPLRVTRRQAEILELVASGLFLLSSACVLLFLASYIWINVHKQDLIYNASRRFPALMRRLVRKVNAHALPEGYDVDTHFNPPYAPWDQRMCVVPDSDLSLFAPLASERRHRGITITDPNIFQPSRTCPACGSRLLDSG